MPLVCKYQILSEFASNGCFDGKQRWVLGAWKELVQTGEELEISKDRSEMVVETG